MFARPSYRAALIRCAILSSSQLAAAQARVRERQASAAKAEKDVDRFKPLVAKEEIAQQVANVPGLLAASFA
jgi:hypothetical protein